MKIKLKRKIPFNKETVSVLSTQKDPSPEQRPDVFLARIQLALSSRNEWD